MTKKQAMYLNEMLQRLATKYFEHHGYKYSIFADVFIESKDCLYPVHSCCDDMIIDALIPIDTCSIEMCGHAEGMYFNIKECVDESVTHCPLCNKDCKNDLYFQNVGVCQECDTL